MWLTPESLYLVSFALIILMKIVCFILSYKIIKLGYNLINSGVKGEFKFSSNFVGFKSDLTSLSPGLLFVLLGVVLMMVAIYTDKSVTLNKDKSPVSVSKDSKDTFVDSVLIPGTDEFNSKDSTKK